MSDTCQVCHDSECSGALQRHPEHLSLAHLRELLVDLGFAALAPRAREIREAARAGALLWTRSRLTTTDASRIDEVAT